MRWALEMTAMLAAAATAHTANDPLLKPISPEYAQRWMGPEGPVHAYGNTWLAGTAGIDVGLIRTSAGLMLIDDAFPQAVPVLRGAPDSGGPPGALEPYRTPARVRIVRNDGSIVLGDVIIIPLATPDNA